MPDDPLETSPVLPDVPKDPPAMREKEKELTPAQEEAAVALAAGFTMEEAGKKAHKCLDTIKRWMRDTPAFKRRIGELREVLTDRTLGLLAAGSADAVTTLIKLLADDKAGVRLKAGDALLTHTLKYRETAELKGQLQNLLSQIEAAEAAAAQRKRP